MLAVGLGLVYLAPGNDTSSAGWMCAQSTLVGGKGGKKWRKAATVSSRVDKNSIRTEDTRRRREGGSKAEAALASGLWSGRSCEVG